MKNNYSRTLQLRKIWTRIRHPPLIGLIASFCIITIESNIRNIDRNSSQLYVLLAIGSYITLMYLISLILPPYPTEEEEKFKFKKTNVLIVDSFLDIHPYKRRKFSKFRENFQVDHIAWTELMNQVINDYQVVILDLNTKLIVNWDLDEERNHLQNEFSKLLEKGGTTIVFVGYCKLSRRTNIAFEDSTKEHEMNVTTFFPHIPTKDYSDREGPYVEFNHMILGLRDLFFSEGKKNFRWFWSLDKDKYTGNCKILAFNSQKDVISGLFLQDKGLVIILPSSFNNRKIISNIMDNIHCIPEIYPQVLENNELDFISKDVPVWIKDLDILGKRKIINEIEHRNRNLKEINEIMKLSYETDFSLERVVYKVLEYFGFKNFKRSVEKADLIFEDRNIRFVSEIKGLDRIPTPKDIRQIYVWIEEEKTEKIPENMQLKGLFICNTERKKPLNKRKQFFHKKLVEEAEKRGWGLITTFELLKAYERLQNKEISRDDIRKSLREQIGIIMLGHGE